jgi:hypothetical protein
MERYTAMYLCGQPGLSDNPVTAYVNNLSVTGTAPGTATTRRTPTTWPHDPTRECNVCVASASRSSDPESAPRHCATNSQRRARLDKLAEAKHQLDEEMAILHWELGQDLEPRDRQPTQMVPVQEQPCEGSGAWQERHPAAEQPRACAATPPAQGCTRDADRRANEGINVDTNADDDAPPLFRRASQNLAVAAMLLRGCPKAATSKERRVRQQLKVLLKAAVAQQEESCSEHG